MSTLGERQFKHLYWPCLEVDDLMAWEEESVLSL